MSNLSGSYDEYDSKQLLASYGVPVGEGIVCTDVSEIAGLEEKMPFPWGMKILSKDIIHKSEAGGVHLNIKSRTEAIRSFDEIIASAKAYAPDADIRGVLISKMISTGFELIMGVNKDPQFGHVILFGLGGIYVEMFKMVSMRLAPLTRYDAEQMIDELPLTKIFKGMRGKFYDKGEVINVLLALSKLVEEHPEIEEIDINPFFIFPVSGCAVDAVVTASQKYI